MTPEEEAERASLAHALQQYHTSPDKYGLPEKGQNGKWTVPERRPPPMLTGGFNGFKPSPDFGTRRPIDELTMQRLSKRSPAQELRQTRIGALKAEWDAGQTKDWITVKHK